MEASNSQTESLQEIESYYKKQLLEYQRYAVSRQSGTQGSVERAPQASSGVEGSELPPAAGNTAPWQNGMQGSTPGSTPPAAGNVAPWQNGKQESTPGSTPPAAGNPASGETAGGMPAPVTGNLPLPSPQPPRRPLAYWKLPQQPIRPNAPQLSQPPAPMPNGTAPAPETPASMPNGTVPTQETPASMPNGTAPAPKAPAPMPNGTVPTPKASAPMPNGIAPTPKASASMPNGIVPTQEASMPQATVPPQTPAPIQNAAVDAENKASLPSPSGLLREQTAVLRPAAMVQSQQGTGRIMAQVTTASGAIPVKGAVVLIQKKEDGQTVFLEQLITDGSGNTPLSRPLQTVSAAESQTPNGANPPYAVYQVLVRAAGFEPYQADDVMVFDQETSLIEAALQPQRENGISSGEGENG